MPTIDISPALETDLERILTLQKEAYLSEAEIYEDYTLPPLRQTLEELLDDFRQQLILKASRNGEIVGSVRAFAQDGECSIGRLFVNRSMQHQGIGTKLMAAIESRFATARRFALFTGHKSSNNLKLYHNLGYRPVREQKISATLTLIHLIKNGAVI